MKTLCILATLFVGVTTQAYERPHFSAHIQFKNMECGRLAGHEQAKV
jgi:hypothetical protein